VINKIDKTMVIIISTGGILIVLQTYLSCRSSTVFTRAKFMACD